jgi:DNA-binding MarR family transcriptional regulator
VTDVLDLPLDDGHDASGDTSDSAIGGTASTLRLGVMRLARRLRVERNTDDLTFNQLAALGTLRRHGPLPIGEIAAHENVKPPSMTRTIACLEEAGLVTRGPSETDGRQVVVELTAEAIRVLDQDRARRTAWLARRLEALSPDELELLAEVAPLLERIATE